MYVEVTVPGSCGELLQGTEGGKPFLVTCPIDKYTKVVVTDKNKEIKGLGEKACMAMKKTLALFGMVEFPFGMQLMSELPKGKGMASSSADIAAVCLATAFAVKREIKDVEIAKIATEIEPTDGVFFAGIVKINHVSGICQKKYGVLPNYKLAIFDTGGVVDTLQFHERGDLQKLNQENETRLKHALQLLENTQSEQDIAAASTCSAMSNQNILYKKKLDEIGATACILGALGINVAHSGTVLGIIFSPLTGKEKIDNAISVLNSDFKELNFLYLADLIPGGYTVKIEE